METLEGRRLLAAGAFNIQIVYGSDLDSASPEAAIVRQAAGRWERALVEDIPNVPAGDWGAPVDDLRVIAEVTDIDGVGGTLASADPHYRRPGSNLPIDGIMRLDAADISNPGLLDIVTHEMGHLLGIGSLWTNFGIINGAGGTDPQYTGAAGLAQYRAYAGSTSLTSVPIENMGGLGTRDVHWREATFGRELMTGYYSSGVVNPLSRMSIASLIDLGYPGVNPDAADAYNLAGGNAIPTIASLSASSAITAPGGSLTLTANTVANTGGTITNVRFYRETNGVDGMQASGNVLNKDTLIATLTAGAPWSTTISLAGLAVGDYIYYAQVTDSFGAVSTWVSATNTIANGPAAPDAPVLSAASDSGISNTDRITNIVLPTFQGVYGTSAGTTIHVFSDAVEIGTSTTDVNGNWTFTATTPLTNGNHAIAVAAQNTAGTSGTSASTPITIDTVAPLLVSSTFAYLTSLSVTFTFNDNVQPSLGGNDVTFQNTTNALPYAATLVSYTGNVARFGFAIFPPPKGDYISTLSGSGVTDVAGNALASSPSIPFFYLPGDIDRSRSVTFDDLLILSQNYGHPGNFSTGDMDYDGVVDFDDLLMLAQNYNTSLAMLAPPSVAEKSTPVTKRKLTDSILA